LCFAFHAWVRALIHQSSVVRKQMPAIGIVSWQGCKSEPSDLRASACIHFLVGSGSLCTCNLLGLSVTCPAIRLSFISAKLDKEIIYRSQCELRGSAGRALNCNSWGSHLRKCSMEDSTIEVPVYVPVCVNLSPIEAEATRTSLLRTDLAPGNRPGDMALS
jgi:hypothetical protein